MMHKGSFVIVVGTLLPSLFGFLLGFQSQFYSSHQAIKVSKFDRKSTCASVKDVVGRTISISSEFNVTVWESKNPAAIIQAYWDSEQSVKEAIKHEETFPKNTIEIGKTRIDPFGLVLWPGAVVAAKEMMHHRSFVKNKSVLVLGTGIGCEAQAAAFLGASKVLATDINPRTLELLQYGAKLGGYGEIISTKLFDIASSIPLSSFDFDFLLVADVMYNENLAYHVARRCEEAYRLDSKPVILVTDSQRIVHSFESELNKRLVPLGHRPVEWDLRLLTNFTGSGVLIEQDQTYSVKARTIWIQQSSL